MRFALVSFLVLAFTGCKHHFPLPYSTNQLRADSDKWPGDALVHYLSQPNADVAVCSLAPPPVVTRTDDELVEPFVMALEKQALAPDRWQACANRLVPAVPPAAQEDFWQRLSKTILALFDMGEPGAERLIAAHEVLAARPRSESPALAKLSQDLVSYRRDGLAPPLMPLFDTFVGTLELESGRFQGRAVTAQDIANAQDDGLLLRMAARLPDDALRTQAKQRLVRLRIERSPTAEVQQRAAEVEVAVMQTGRWAQPASALKLAGPEAPAELPFTMLVQQNVEQQVVTLISKGEERVDVAPVIDVGPLLRFSVGWSRPLGVCQPPAALSVEPCVDGREVEISTNEVSVDDEGRLHLPEQLSMERAVEIARAGEGIVVPVRLSGKLVTSLSVPLQFLAPPPIVYMGEVAAQGPSVNVVVHPSPTGLLFSTVDERGERRLAVLGKGTTGGFEIVSLGGPGYDGQEGQRGYDGNRGYDGSSARCPSTPAQDGGRGGNGTRGGDGGPGGPGGAGGFVSVSIQCGGTCPEVERLVRLIVFSRGGKGGDGGAGGRGGEGGRGGSGGSSASCKGNFLSSGSSGRNGDDGQRGRAGQDGPQGRAGVVQVRVE